MRPLSDEEMQTFFGKLQPYIGSNLNKLIDRKDEPHTFRYMNDRVYYLSEAHLKLASNISRDNLMSVGVCFGKFTKGGKFRMHVTCLDYLAQYAKYKVWVKTGAEMSFLYGNNVTKAGLARITDSTPQYGGSWCSVWPMCHWGSGWRRSRLSIARIWTPLATLFSTREMWASTCVQKQLD